MKQPQIEPIAMDATLMWTLNADKQSIRLTLPPLPIAGQAEPLFVVLDFEATTIDETIDRLLSLRAKMQPRPVERTRH